MKRQTANTIAIMVAIFFIMRYLLLFLKKYVRFGHDVFNLKPAGAERPAFRYTIDLSALFSNTANTLFPSAQTLLGVCHLIINNNQFGHLYKLPKKIPRQQVSRKDQQPVLFLPGGLRIRCGF
jgi:hypothetical protein